MKPIDPFGGGEFGPVIPLFGGGGDFEPDVAEL